ncbi:MAG: thiamine phosphate synthase [Bryobacterales bacterium]|nr:thiamine phosphate synthase [Bryobacterales bacterium]
MVHATGRWRATITGVLRCYITDRHQAGGPDALFALIARALELGVEIVQVREKDWDARSLTAFTERVLALPNPHHSLIVLNGRADIALATGAHGVHLPSDGIAPERLRAIAPPRFVIGVSCHTRAAMDRTLAEDADYVFLSPVFAPISKDDARPTLGIEGLREAVKGYPIPTFALGGITPETMAECLDAGAPGVAGISLFQCHLLL